MALDRPKRKRPRSNKPIFSSDEDEDDDDGFIVEDSTTSRSKMISSKNAKKHKSSKKEFSKPERRPMLPESSGGDAERLKDTWREENPVVGDIPNRLLVMSGEDKDRFITEMCRDYPSAAGPTFYSLGIKQLYRSYTVMVSTFYDKLRAMPETEKARFPKNHCEQHIKRCLLKLTTDTNARQDPLGAMKAICFICSYLPDQDAAHGYHFDTHNVSAIQVEAIVNLLNVCDPITPNIADEMRRIWNKVTKERHLDADCEPLEVHAAITRRLEASAARNRRLIQYEKDAAQQAALRAHPSNGQTSIAVTQVKQEASINMISKNTSLPRKATNGGPKAIEILDSSDDEEVEIEVEEEEEENKRKPQPRLPITSKTLMGLKFGKYSQQSPKKRQ